MDYHGEIRHLRERCATLEQELAECKNALKEEKQKHRRLRRAIPSLPKPEQLYKNIVSRCQEFHECTQRISSISSRIRNLHTSQADWEKRFHELELLEVMCDRMRLEFLFVRCQIRTLFSVPPLLIAKGAISAAIWNTWMQKEQLNNEDDPLLMDPEIIETAVADQLQLLDGHRLTLKDLRTALQDENIMNSTTFQESVTEKLRQIQSTLEEFIQQRNNVGMFAQHAVDQQELPRHGQEPPAVGEGVPQEAHEQEIIRENAEFMEGIQDLEAEQADAQPIEPEDHEPGHERPRDHPEPREDEPPREPPQPENPEPEDDHPRNVEEPENPALAMRRREVEREIRQLRQAESNFRRSIQALLETPTCPPRRFELGEIRSRELRYMRCAFCEAMGEHYSDSCHIISSVEHRRRLVDERRLCILCLEYCNGGQFCKKRSTICYHCRKTGHHSALCELPETTPLTLQQLTMARLGLGRCERRIRELETYLQHLHN